VGRRFWGKLRSERGVAALEFAIVAQVLFLLLYGMILYGFIFALDHNLTQSAAEGARSAIGYTSNWEQHAEDAARQKLSFMQAETYADVNAVKAACSYNASLQCITVTITYDNRAHPVLPAFLGMQYLTPGTITATSTVELD
jgi:Flp pilus assembly protein TadG